MTNPNTEQLEAAMERLARAALLGDVKITIEDRLRGAVIEALSRLEAGQPAEAYRALVEASKL